MTFPGLRFILAALAASWSASAIAADGAHPTVVELFQSQGCSSCPPANANLMALIGRPDILALSFGVTYWDQLGWKDTFAQPTFTARQWDYAHALKHQSVFTPQVVVNGRRDGVGANPAELRALIVAGDRGVGGPSLSFRPGQAIVGAAPSPTGGADVWLVRYDPRIVQVPIQRGENAGRTLPHRDVVRQLTRLGHWRGRAASFDVAAASPGLATAILVQAGPGGPILAAARS
ncbi:MAG TPA: DUF1223 domain-containing protein [Caulobacteraceae bacterium]